MPQHTRHSLTHVLLLWTTILSIIQVVFIIFFFFSAGHHGPSQNNSAVAAEHTMQIQANNTPSPPSDDSALLGKGRMLTFEAAQVGKNITWVAKSPDMGPVSEKGEVLNIMKDGYYLIILQVTLSSCKGSEHKVSLKWNNKVLLQGQIITNTCSTGVLGKVEEMSAGGTLAVTIDPPNSDLNTTESVTHLDIIYIHKP
ncbi:hypothetical protein EXN66_Car015753 [Channa argus]|uniref:TNF family profile domain-containing protein n=2 Tax=Channa argus TaxID=215402 RepID=A0A6G1QD63_CHAAH|nr:hypothetical protein EXN66_Car015753 [Channa argus]KAK2893729.1 hypothetical protein Q8A73_016213 [Channa argus]